MTKYLITVIVFSCILSGCDPAYSIYVRNTNSSVIYLKTHPSIESLYDYQSTYYDSIRARNLSQGDHMATYRIMPNETFRVYGHIGIQATLKDLPFDYVEMIQGTDTVLLDSKEKIFAHLIRERNTRKYFVIEPASGPN